MYLRHLLPRSLRWRRALHYVERAALCTSRARDADLAGDHVLANRWHRLSLTSEMLALRWCPVEHPGMIPLPGEELLTTDREYRCVICDESIPPRMSNQEDDGRAGLYCDLCAGYYLG